VAYNPKHTDPRIVFCTTCKGRVEHLAQTLPRNLKDNADYPNCKFVVLDYGDQATRTYLRTYHANDIASGRLVTYAYQSDGVFHMAHAKNMVARCGILEGADILVTLDADNFAAPGFARYIAAHLRDNSFMCPDFPLIESIPHGPDRPARGYAGRLAIRAQDFVKAGGYDEEYDTWRGEDIDMICRLQRMGHTMQHFDNRFLDAVRHNAEVRFREWPHAQKYEENRNEIRICAMRTETVVNYGKIGVGTVYRNIGAGVPYRDYIPEQITLKPLPTRVFGIGMHKTATTSLDHAFKILGFDSFHFNSGNEARMIWEEMNTLSRSRTLELDHMASRSKTLEEWYALCDLPIPMLYVKLDLAYPGSKFILTVRGEEGWIRSVERLWSAEYNPYRWTWDAYPFSHRIHTALYGQKEFDAQVFIERYRRHNAEVREYFKSRPDDLLVMDMDAGAGWMELCDFLNMPTPNVPYPIGNQTTSAAPGQSRTYKADARFREWIGLKPVYPCD
jgi:hypothetical protein